MSRHYDRAPLADLPNLANFDYVDRVNRAIDHITRNLAQPLQLAEVAKVACFSSFHFHRIFRALLGETLAGFVKRVRLERAVFLMAHDRARTLTGIALECGFSSSSDFSRSFRGRFGVAPRRFDLERWRSSRREALHSSLTPDHEHHLSARLPPVANPDGFTVRLCKVPARRVAYLRVHRPFEGDHVARAAARMLAWARARKVSGGQWLGYQWEDPEIVPLEQCRYDVALELPEGFDARGEVSVAEFAPMTLAEIDLAGPLELELRALQFLYGTWLPASGRVPDHQPCFEAWNGLPFEHGTAHFDLRLQLAVV